MNKLIEIAKSYQDGLITTLEARNLIAIHIVDEKFDEEAIIELCEAIVDAE